MYLNTLLTITSKPGQQPKTDPTVDPNADPTLHPYKNHDQHQLRQVFFA